MSDWGDLSEQLRKLGVKIGGPIEKPLRNHFPIEKVIDCIEINTRCGPVLSLKNIYPADYAHGDRIIKANNSFNRFLDWSGIPKETSICLEHLVFIDTETTGLAGGTGTLAFMIGVGKFVGNIFQLEQFFLRNPSEEEAVLHALSDFCKNMKAVVSYNGKAFDIPILNTRHILQRIPSPFIHTDHIDLLTISRQLWRLRLSECRLSSIENNILNFHRNENDVPGYLVPKLYKDYLQTGDSRPLKGVFYHNQKDVLSLAALFSLISKIIESPFSENIYHAIDAFSMAKIFERLNEHEIAHKLYNNAKLKEQNKLLRTRYLLQQANLYKRQKLYNLALPLWKDAANNGSIVAIEELAKYYEHHLKDFKKALFQTERAIDKLQKEDNLNTSLLDKFIHRKYRLLNK